MYFDRYKKFRENGEMKPLPGIKIPESSSDLFALYKNCSAARLSRRGGYLILC